MSDIDRWHQKPYDFDAREIPNSRYVLVLDGTTLDAKWCFPTSHVGFVFMSVSKDMW